MIIVLSSLLHHPWLYGSMKALNWWAANKIAGIPEIRCGLRDDKHRTIKRIETIQTDRLATSRYTEVICIDIIISLL